MHVYVFGEQRDALCDGIEIGLVLLNVICIRDNPTIMILSADISITLVSMNKFLKIPHVFCEIFPDFSNLLIEVLRQICDLGVEVLDDPLFVQLVVGFQLTKLRFDDRYGLFNLIVRDGCDEIFELLLNLGDELPFFLPVHGLRTSYAQSTFVASQHFLDHRHHLIGVGHLRIKLLELRILIKRLRLLFASIAFITGDPR